VRFGVFELDLNTGELCKNGRKLNCRSSRFGFKSVAGAAGPDRHARAAERGALASDTFVDFDHSLNAAIAKLRQALGDSAENPSLH
jgi:hypothetical protein